MKISFLAFRFFVVTFMASFTTDAGQPGRGVPGALDAATSESVLISTSQGWKYNESGQDLGTTWKEVGYADDGWPSGQALFGHERNPFSEPFLTDLNLFPPDNTNQITTYYFRTHFQFSGNTTGLVLVAGLLIDDGAVLYLNGMEVYRIRVAPAQDYGTFATSYQFYEGYYELVNLPIENLIEGDNIFAVDLHQSSYPGNTNVAFGMTLRAAWVEPVSISKQPGFQGGVQGLPTTFSATASGSLPHYQWFKDGAEVPDATNSSFTVASTQPADAGFYSVMISNSLGSVATSNLDFSVFPVSAPFRLLSATNNPAFNLIFILFSQNVLASTATNAGNYIVTLQGDTNPLPITKVLSLGPNVKLTIGAPPLNPNSNYILTVNGVADVNTNLLAPNSQVIIWGLYPPPTFFEIVPSHAAWRFSRDPLFEDLGGKWKEIGYNDSKWQGPSNAYFASTNFETSTPIDTRVAFVGPTYYFRTALTITNTIFSRAILRIFSSFMSGTVYYLNGVEILRERMNPGPVNFYTFSWTFSPGRAPGSPIPVFGHDVVVSNLLTGANILAVEVHQPGYPIIMLNSSAPDMLFGAQVLASLQTRSLPPLTITRQEDINVLTWPVSTGILESANDIMGQWTPVAFNTNSFTTPTSDQRRYFRLRSQ